MSKNTFGIYFLMGIAPLLFIFDFCTVKTAEKKVLTPIDKESCKADTSRNNTSENLSNRHKLDSQYYEIRYHWAVEPYVQDGSFNCVMKIDFIDNESDSIVFFYDVINNNPFIFEQLTKSGVNTDEGSCYSSLRFHKDHVDPIFENAENVHLSCPIVRYNQDYVAITYNATCRYDEHPFKYKSSIILLNKYGEIIYDSGIIERSAHQVNVSEKGKFLFYYYEDFLIDDDYPSVQDVELVIVDKEHSLHAVHTTAPDDFQKIYLLNNSDSLSSSIVMFDTKMHQVKIKELPIDLRNISFDFFDDGVIVLDSAVGNKNKEKISIYYKDFDEIEFLF